ncbi:hypothetical protein CcCBS67573_g07536 [Chytriomyces confervae]|uniref:Protein kinase domain-containing protein n=1 Tax=Chytriomyces confervae TaxID=246404 RepID=A0A507EVR0_9FUNG|nr:hypothetical protein CcCBS67573_g07536 [Chytriomyces confervae]
MTVALFASAPGHMCFAPMSYKEPATQRPAKSTTEPKLPKQATKKSESGAKAQPSQALYAGLSLEAKARAAVVNAFVNSPVELTTVFQVKSIIGFGSNGVVLAAKNMTLEGAPATVAIKIIYKAEPSLNAPTPSEIDAFRTLSGTFNIPLITQYVADWQDANHFYLVSQIFGSNWEAASPLAIGDSFKPLAFKLTHEDKTTRFVFPFSSGSSDLWSWSQAHRAHMFQTEKHSFLPTEPVKHIVKQMATALSQIHAQGYYHGDVKIENCLVRGSDDADRPTIRLTDFGHAKKVDMPISSYGTQDVSPPEFLFDSPYDRASLDGTKADIFALGLVLYVLLNSDGELPAAVGAIRARMVGYEALLARDGGRYPFDAIPDLDESAWDLMNGMCQVDPSKRMSIEDILAHPWLA